MAARTDNQHYHLILADIAMMAAINTYDHQSATETGAGYTPGSIRDGWLARTADPALRSRVTAMAAAALGSLKNMAATQLAAVARTYGVPLAADEAERMEQHFNGKRNAVLTYQRTRGNAVSA
ncbi:hypothetical protein [Rhodopila globiformis]|uniref:Uncharacterized protein n=1 Tax=Rhodopila globiformis TaxID=1071 RepID=A0A2S6NK39_RHOGL|nr:hypothetical protein [Rhodopila globiformis]PPQ35351.1 hypothetical protein CCS01_07630 [Rhodopila globiformis]